MAQNPTNSLDQRAPDAIDVAGFIDQQPVGRFQIRLLLLCAAVLFIDGFDTQASAMSRRRSRRIGNWRAARLDPSSALACSDS